MASWNSADSAKRPIDWNVAAAIHAPCGDSGRVAYALPVTSFAAPACGWRITIASGQVRNVNNNETVGNITISIGVASYCLGEAAADFVGRADRALYAAKALGRNRVSVADGGARQAVA